MYVRNGMLIATRRSTGDPRPIAIMTLTEIPLAGKHNVENVMAALLAALLSAASRSPCARRSRFEPMPHRLADGRRVDGVRYVDDSKATNPAAVIAALRSFDRPVILIAGGRPKGIDFPTLGAKFATAQRR